MYYLTIKQIIIFFIITLSSFSRPFLEILIVVCWNFCWIFHGSYSLLYYVHLFLSVLHSESFFHSFLQFINFLFSCIYIIYPLTSWKKFTGCVAFPNYFSSLLSMFIITLFFPSSMVSAISLVISTILGAVSFRLFCSLTFLDFLLFQSCIC